MKRLFVYRHTIVKNESAGGLAWPPASDDTTLFSIHRTNVPANRFLVEEKLNNRARLFPEKRNAATGKNARISRSHVGTKW